MTAIALTVFSVCCGCLGAVLAAQAGFGIALTLTSYLLCATLSSTLSVLLMMRYSAPAFERGESQHT